jgi:hypothetical protein
MAFPIPLLLGAFAFLFAAKKKKPPPTRMPTNTPPPLPSAAKNASSGYSNVTRERMQEIQTLLISNGYDPGIPDGKYGPKTRTAVEEFQEDWGQGLGVDGKPGKNTQTALEEAEAGRLRALQQVAKSQPAAQVLDQCNPLDVGTWGTGNVCTFDGSRWVLQKGVLPKNAVPPISAKEVGFSADYSKLAVGSQFRLGVLDPWLNARRKKGLLATKNHGPTFAEYFVDNPESFLSSIFGVKKAGGELIYGALTLMATGGMGLGAKAIQLAVAKMAASLTLKASTIGATGLMMEKLFGTDAVGMAASMMEAGRAFAESHTVIVGTKKVKISSLPADRNSVKSFNKYIMDYVLKFQKMHF